ncbi:MAG: ATP-binding protein [Chloroflexota bacterium]
MPEPRAARRARRVGKADMIAVLELVARTADDAIAVTDLDARVVIWNAASERLFGIPASLALGRSIFDLSEPFIVGRGDARDPRQTALATGSWRGRRIERARIGPNAGREVIVESALSRIDDSDGSAIGVISIRRDVTASVRLEQELAALGTLATATGVARTREEVADGAIGLLCTATRADYGVIIRHDDGATVVEGSRGSWPELVTIIGEGGPGDAPMAAALRTPGGVLTGTLETLPMRPSSRDVLRRHGVAAMATVGLHHQGVLTGRIALGWKEATAARPSEAALVQAAAHVEHALENITLVERIVNQASSERRQTAQLRALDELTKLGQESQTTEALAGRSARLINSAVGAVGTAYGLIDTVEPGRGRYGTSEFVNLPDALSRHLEGRSSLERLALTRWLSGEGSFVQDCPTQDGLDEAAAAAAAAGFRSLAAIPIRVDGQLAGGIVAFFDTTRDQVTIDQGGLDAIERTVGISLANHRLREHLSASERRYRTLFDESPEALLLETWTGEIVDANAAALRTFRTDRAGLVGRVGSEVTGMEPESLRGAHAAGRSVGSATIRSTGTAIDGRSFPIELEIAPVEIDGASRLLVLVRDLSIQAELQAELIQAQKMDAIGQLVSGVAHELNNPLAAIIAFSQLIRRDPNLPDDLRRDADALNQEADRTRRIVQNLLDFARQRPPERHPTRLDALVRTVLELQAYMLSTNRIEVTLDIPASLPSVPIDRSQLQQVLLNLTRNAVQAVASAADHGRIAFSAREFDAGPPTATRRMIRLAVTDDGPGVKVEHRDRLFLPFFTTKPPGEGTGLGLPVSFGIVAAHNGHLRFEPGPGGRGATFVIELPVDADAAGPGPVRVKGSARSEETPQAGVDPPAEIGTEAVVTSLMSSARAAAPAATILVLDDEPSIRLLLSRILRSAGHRPLMAADGPEALALVRRGDVQAVLCDHRMAGMSGIDVFEAVVALRPDLATRFVFMSGDVLNAELREFAHDRGIGLLAKPFDVEAAVGAIDNLLRGEPIGGPVVPADAGTVVNPARDGPQPSRERG